MIRRILTVVLSGVVVGIAVLWWLGRDMRYVTATVDIAAPPEKVWAAIADVNAWADWHSQITAASGTMALGEVLDITMIGPDSPDGPNYQPVVVDLTPFQHMRWRAKMAAAIVFTNDKIYKLEATDTGTRVTHTEGFSGIMLPVMWGMMETGVPPIIEAMNRDLQTKVTEN